ncbi:MAG: hypothetical protein QOF98_1868, partial [Streptomyces sp.]|nr:hypothetical protein [Streptomyces sp.]
TWRFALRVLGEIGLRAPMGANVAGSDFITARINPNGTVTIFVNDAKLSVRGRFPTPATSIPLTWGEEVRQAIAPGRLDLGDPVLEEAIRRAFAEGRVETRQLNADYSPAGGGAITVPEPPTP